MNAMTTTTVAAATSLRFPARPIEGLAGTSFKHEHLPAIVAAGPQRGFFEVHAENYMGAGGPPHAALSQIRQDYPVSLHGVCMSIGGPQSLDKAHLGRFKALVDRYEPARGGFSSLAVPTITHEICRHLRDSGHDRSPFRSDCGEHRQSL